MFVIDFDGEKDLGELGPQVKYALDYKGLRARSWKSYLDNRITQTVINKFITWVISSGLKLQSEPVVSVLQDNNINIEPEKYSKMIEDRFKLWSKSTRVDYSGQRNLAAIAKEVEKNIFRS